MPGHRFVYGPVASRRLGFSLGVDIIPFKTCTLDCTYCQLGSTGKTSVRRASWFPPEEILGKLPFLEKKYRETRTSPDHGAGKRWIMGNLSKTALGNISLRELSKKITV